MQNRKNFDSGSLNRHVIRMEMKAKKKNNGMARKWACGKNSLIGLILKAHEQILQMLYHAME